jgi:hypothetical protein
VGFHGKYVIITSLIVILGTLMTVRLVEKREKGEKRVFMKERKPEVQREANIGEMRN